MAARSPERPDFFFFLVLVLGARLSGLDVDMAQGDEFASVCTGSAVCLYRISLVVARCEGKRDNGLSHWNAVDVGAGLEG